VKRVGFVHHPSSLAHEMPSGHPERSDRIVAILEHLRRTELDAALIHHEPDPATTATIELAHDPALLRLLRELDERGGGRIDLDTSMGPHSLDAASRASQGVVDAVRNVLAGEWDAAFSCMRPPGHHARPRVPMGFCLVNHVAVAARWALAHGGVERVAIIDWDAHHGNGTQEIFWSDPRVLYVSLHQYPWYPGTGDVTERGEADAFGSTLNVPLPAETAEDAYERALGEVIEPRVASFAPDLVFVSAGFDAHHADPLCMMRLAAGAYFRFTKRVAGWGRGPVCVLEGGYDLDGLAASAGAMVSALLELDEPAGVTRAELARLDGTPEAHAWVRRAAELR
jgi:acetoin utilization deacetylase AcuC-like enzyme